VTSCGCFGDAIPLTPWQSFSKDLVLLALILIIFFNRKQLRSIIKGSGNQFVATVITAIISLGIGIYTVNYLPFIDFLPYKVGNNLPSLMVLPEGKQGDLFEQIYTMKNKKTGETKRSMTRSIWLTSYGKMNRGKL
jgi:hypothetical protein